MKEIFVKNAQHCYGLYKKINLREIILKWRTAELKLLTFSGPRI